MAAAWMAGLSASALTPYAPLVASAPSSGTTPVMATVSPSAPAAPMAYTPPAVFHTGSLPTPFHFGSHITVKLTPDNYIFWRAQVLPLLGSHYLLGYVDDSLPCPPALVDSVNGPGSLSPSVTGLIVFAKTSQEAWTILERSFASQSQARASSLRRELGDCEKLDSSATEFYNKVKGLADTLASIGLPLTDSEFNSFIVNGLDEEYDGLVEIINERAQTSPLMAHEVYSRLLLTEQRVEARRANRNRGSSASANAAYKGPSSPAPAKGGATPPSPQPTSIPTTLPGSGGRRVCQLCGLDGHWASKCHRRFQKSFLGLGNDGKDTRNAARQVAMADKPAPPPKSQGSTQSYSVDPYWYMDSGATEHLTSEMGKLQSREPYQGSDKVHTANGAVPKLTYDNNVFCEFHPFDLFIKDRDTRDVLLSGRLCQGLYRLEHPGVSRVFSGVRVSPSQWHARLGHPATPIFQKHVERLLKHQIVHVQSDWGGEYRNLNSFFQSLGIAHRLACPHTHQQNGSVELLLPNHGAGTGCRARLEILEATEPPLDTPPASHIDRPMHGMGSRAHAHRDPAPSPPPASHVDPPMHGVESRAHADDAPSTPRASSPGAGPSPQPFTPAASPRPLSPRASSPGDGPPSPPVVSPRSPTPDASPGVPSSPDSSPGASPTPSSDASPSPSSAGSSSDAPSTSKAPVLRPHTRSRSGIYRPLERTDGTVAWYAACMAAAVADPSSEPRTYQAAMGIPHWRQAMEQEYNALLRNETWTLVPSPPRVNIIDSKWVFKVKKHSDGSIERYKARLVARVFVSVMVLTMKTPSVQWSSLPPSGCFCLLL
ncbi:uncharacterized protein [Lolium perenne]|uniref:uncharacterized protein n=1 Tax=Lolium perenne TaxID=4522 RepID=UPI003A99C047